MLARDVPAALGRGPVLDVDRGDADLLVLLHRASDVVDAAVARITVRDHGQVRRLDDPLRVLDHLGHRHHLQVREAELAEHRRVTRHVRGVDPGRLREADVEGVIDARREGVFLLVQYSSVRNR
jgi:hypothetical protein